MPARLIKISASRSYEVCFSISLLECAKAMTSKAADDRLHRSESPARRTRSADSELKSTVSAAVLGFWCFSADQVAVR
jgi:hypothetical protein